MRERDTEISGDVIPKRVLIVGETPLRKPNGVTTSINKFNSELLQLGHETMVIAPKPSPHDLEGSHVLRTGFLPLFDHSVGIITGKRMNHAVRNFAPDVIHLASPVDFQLPLPGDIRAGLSGRALDAADSLGIPTVAIIQTDVPGYVPRYIKGPLQDLAFQYARENTARIYNRATLNLAPSTATRAAYEGYGVKNDPPIEILRRGVDSRLFRPDPRDTLDVSRLRQEILGDDNPDTLIVGYVGRLALEKRVKRFRALKGLNVKIAIVGEGETKEDVQAALGDQVVFLGQLEGEELATAYRSFDMFAHTGTEETFGQTLQEAMATGLAVVAPNKGGPKDIVLHNETGFLYEPEDDDDLREKVKLMIENPEMRREMGRRGLEVVKPRTWQAITGQLDEYYNKAIAIHQFRKAV